MSIPFGAPAFKGAPKSKIINRFTDSAAKTFKSLPSTLGITSAPQQIEQQQALLNQGAPQTAPQSNINDIPEAITTPNAMPDREPSDGIGGIAAIGRAATAETRIKAANRQREAQAQARALGDTGDISFDFNGSGEGSGLDAEQLNYARGIANVGKQRGASDEDIQIALMTALAESGLRNLNYGDRDSVGLFQQRTSQGWGSIQQIMDPTYSAGKFFDTLKGSARGANPWNTAQNVQRSAFADGSNYQAQYGKAQQAFKSIYSPQQGVSTSPVPGRNGSASWINANVGKYHDFDGMYGAQCVDLYNFYMSGFVGSKNFMRGVPYAEGLWNPGGYDEGTMVRIASNQRPQMGDVAIWSNAMNGAGGHVAIVSQDNGNGSIRVINANATSAGSRGNTVMSNLSKGNLLGYLRPRKLM